MWPKKAEFSVVIRESWYSCITNPKLGSSGLALLGVLQGMTPGKAGESSTHQELSLILI